MAWAAVRSKVVVLLLLIYCLMYFALFVGVLCMSLFCYALLCVHSSFAIILKKKRKLEALLLLSYRCIVTINVLGLFLRVSWVGLQFVIVVFPDHTHLLFGDVNLYCRKSTSDVMLTVSLFHFKCLQPVGRKRKSNFLPLSIKCCQINI